MATKKRKIEDAEILAAGREDPAEEQPQPVNGSPQMSKAEAVRQAMAAGMGDISAIEAYVRREFGIEMPRTQLSAYASQNRARLRKADGGEVRTRTRSSAPVQFGIPASFASDVKEIRELVERIGGSDMFKDTVGQLTGLIGKYGSGALTAALQSLARGDSCSGSSTV